MSGARHRTSPLETMEEIDAESDADGVDEDVEQSRVPASDEMLMELVRRCVRDSGRHGR